MWFEADRWENELWLTLYGSHADGRPNYEDYTEIDLMASGASGGSSSAPSDAQGGIGGQTGAVRSGPGRTARR